MFVLKKELNTLH